MTLILFLLAVLAAGFLVFFAVAGFFIMPSTTQRLGAYPKLRARWNQQHIAHFPKEMPADATLQKFSHFQGFLQGGAHIQLRLQLPPERIQALHDEFARQCTTSFWGGSKYSHVSKHDGMPTTNFFTRGSSPLEFPSDYKLMIFDRVLTKSERMPFMWNHGSSQGVAISVQRHEIVYWAESW